jgi:hypothetical protein
MKKNITLSTLILFFGLFYSCDYLDVVPDNVPTLDHSFSNRMEAERFLYTCYSYIPDLSNTNNIGLCGADEIWTNRYRINDPLRIARGEQGINDPLLNFWEGRRSANVNLYNGIRDCNIFLEMLEDVSKIQDLGQTMRNRWIAEVKFLKAYYHWYLFRMYGPIVIADKNIPIDATVEEVRVKRQPVDSVVNYINNLYDEALGGAAGMEAQILPKKIFNEQTELGRITQPIVLAMKARLLVTAASPLFNGNPDYVDFKDKDGVQLFPTKYDPKKWEVARDACATALASAEEAGFKPFVFVHAKDGMPEEILLQMNIRNSFCEEQWQYNTEMIWGLSGRLAGSDLQEKSMSRLNPVAGQSNVVARDELSPTIQATKFYYTKNGVPIDEDKTWTGRGQELEIQTISAEYKHLLCEGYSISKEHFDREPRFYANLAFDGSVWYMNNSTNFTTWTVKSRTGQQQAKYGTDWFCVTGYWPKKLVNWQFVIRDDNTASTQAYPWPEMRLSDLYLLYAETLNETGDKALAIEYIDKVRTRVGLKGVVESWTNYSEQTDKWTYYDGLKEIIKQERTIEFMFEGQRYWDVRRWKDLLKLNQQITGWDYEQVTPEAYYRPKVIFEQTFSPRDYLSPIRQEALIINPNLVQNPGW